jgi:uncharacterized protein YjaZ
MENSNGFASVLDDLLSGRKTVEQVKEQLQDSKFYLRAGKNYRELKFNGFANIGETAVSVYVADEKVDTFGNKVESKPRAKKDTPAKRK